MTNHVGRLYAAAIGVLVLFLSWAAVAAHPWATPKAEPAAAADRAAGAGARRGETALVEHRSSRQRAAAAQGSQRRSAAARAQPRPPQPRVRVVTLPPLTITRTS